MDLQLIKLNISHYQEALDLICSSYHKMQSLCIVMKTSKQVLKQFFASRVEEGCKSGISLAFIDPKTAKIVAVSMATTLQRYKKVVVPYISEMQPRVQLDRQLHGDLLPSENTDKIAYGMQSATHPDYAKQNLYRLLGFKYFQLLPQMGIWENYFTLFGNIKQQKTFASLYGFSILNTISLKAFEFKGQKVFSGIEDCDEVKLVRFGFPKSQNQQPKPSL